MAGAPVGIPTPDEIRDQLGRMLRARRFIANEKSSLFLALVVEMALSGAEITQSVIGLELFGEKYERDDISDVRVLAIKVRKVIAEYYQVDAPDDPVLIELPAPAGKKAPKPPPGLAYRPLFSYNPRSVAQKEFQLGEFYRERGMWGDCDRAFRHYMKAITIAPNHNQARLGAAEAGCEIAEWEVYSKGEADPRGCELILVWVNIVDRKIEAYWRQYAVRGRILGVYGRIDEAEECFKKALSHDKAATESYPPYFAQLAATNRTDEALRLARKYFDAHIGNINAHIIWASALLWADKVDEAAKVLENALDMDRHAYRVHLQLGAVRQMQNRHEEAQAHFEKVVNLVEPVTFDLIREALLSAPPKSS